MVPLVLVNIAPFTLEVPETLSAPDIQAALTVELVSARVP